MGIGATTTDEAESLDITPAGVDGVEQNAAAQ